MSLRKALICGKWKVEFENQLSKTKGSRENDPWINQLLGDRLEDVSCSTSGGYELLKDLPKELSVIEFYGGTGVQSTVIDQVLKPKNHVIIEQDEVCVRQLEHLFGNKKTVQIICGDAKQYMKDANADLYLLDWNTWTIAHWERWHELWGYLFSTNPVALSWYDTSRPYFHTNKKLYGKILDGEVTDFSQYTQGVSSLIEAKYGYALAKAVYCPRATYYLAMPTPQKLQESHIQRGSGGFVWQD